jgi:O-acetyl-ADP-ribose deacetylase (regulator of RNase III)
MWSLLVELGRWNAEAEAEVEVKATHDEAQTQAQTTRRRRTIIERVLMTGLGTGTGQVSAARCAQQMILAIKHFAQDDMPKEADWGNVDGVIKQVNATLES